MKITDEAKELLMKMMGSNGNDCLKPKVQKSGCGSSIYLSMGKLQEGDNPIPINGINVLMDSETQTRAEKVTLTTEKARLKIQDDSEPCC